jgi:hypothetical protein
MGTKGDGTRIVKGVLPTLCVFFIGLGVWVSWDSTAPHVASAIQIRSWEPAEARLLAVDLERHHNRSSRSTTTTYEVKARYAYTWQGKPFEGTRIGVATEPDNIGSWQNETHARLREALKKSQPVTAWVDPAAPDRAVLDRDLRLGLLAMKSVFGLIFIGVGSLLAAALFLKWPPPENDSQPAG